MNEELMTKLYEYLNEKLNVIKVDGKNISLDAGACYTTSWVASKILNKLGYNCRPQRVGYIIANEIGRNLFSENPKIEKEELISKGGWAIALGIKHYEEDIDNNHWVVYFPKEKQILDLTIGQANRPEHNIIINPFWCDESEKDLPKEILQIYFYKNDVQENQIKNIPHIREYLKKVIKGFKWEK